MTPLKLNVFFSWYPYGGNGGCSTEHPNLRSWFAETTRYCQTDPRIGGITSQDYSDTPIPMLRNRAVVDARKAGADVLIMMDSDQHPDLYLDVEGADAVPFFKSSFDFLYERRLKGMTTVVGAPYCGPPSSEVVYVFKWENNESHSQNVDHRLEMYSREQASQMAGIHPCAALPTGCIMFDMELFEVTDPKHEYAALCQRYGDKEVAKLLTKPWFYYEYSNIYSSEKASTEDVTATRDMVLCAYAKLGYNVMYCNWSAWAGHWKPKCVGKPVILTSDSINHKYQEAVASGRRREAKMIDLTILNSGKQALPVQTKVVYNHTVNDTLAPEIVE